MVTDVLPPGQVAEVPQIVGDVCMSVLSVQLPPGHVTEVTAKGCTASKFPLSVPEPETRFTPVNVEPVVPV
jgi:hypothetical protein